MFMLNMIIMWITITIYFDFSHVSIYSLFVLTSKKLRHKFLFFVFFTFEIYSIYRRNHSIKRTAARTPARALYAYFQMYSFNINIVCKSILNLL